MWRHLSDLLSRLFNLTIKQEIVKFDILLTVHLCDYVKVLGKYCILIFQIGARIFQEQTCFFNFYPTIIANSELRVFPAIIQLRRSAFFAHFMRRA